MITQIPIKVRTAIQEDTQKLANLIHFEAYVHRHLDWRPPLDWVGHSPYLVADQRNDLAAALACPPDPPSVSWIRLFAVSSLITVERAWRALWPEARSALETHQGVNRVAAIPLQNWFRSILEKSGFEFVQSILMLNWERNTPLPGDNAPGLLIRSMNFDDLDAVEQIDAQAFGEVWQNSRDALTLAFRQAAIATVAEEDGKVIGYQISTATPIGGHLARLAVSPQAQGLGVGYSMLRDLLSQFERRGAQTVTVNTQQDNKISLTLYQKAGFRLTGEEYPVCQFLLH